MVLAILTLCLASFIACGQDTPPSPDGSDDSGDQSTPPSNEGGSKGPAIIQPIEKDYGRDTVDFSELGYRRPSIESIIEVIDAATQAVSANEISFEEQLAKIDEADELIGNVRSMYAIANIYNSKDASSTFWNGEYEYIKTNLPTFNKSIEELLVACARSEHKARYEEECFEGSLDEYVDGGKYTDEVVALMEQENALEAEYSSFSTATVVITYGDKTGTVDELLAELGQKYPENSTSYLSYKTVYETLYTQEVDRLSRPIFVELIKIRRLIADELGYDSYAEYAYEYLDHQYSEEEMLSFLEDVRDYVIPVYSKLSSILFDSYFQTTISSTVDKVEVINDLYSVYRDIDPELLDVYSYMLQHGLYDIADESANRFSGAFTTYIYSNNSPFIFMSAEGKIVDYMTLAHEFGHFYDGYVNYNENSSLDLNEVSSQALELITLQKLGNYVLPADQKYLYYYEMNSALETLLYQGFYAYFEHLVYNIPYDMISEQTINAAVAQASDFMFGHPGLNDMYYVLIPHTILEPFYVQSYCTSVSVALEIFFLEAESEGAGIEVYKKLVLVEDELSFVEKLLEAGLENPFAEDYLKHIADLIHFEVVGSHYFEQSDESNAA